MLKRFSSRTTDLGADFLSKRLRGAVSYDRIAGYFSSSALEIAGEALEQVRDKIRVVCNGGVSADDKKITDIAAAFTADELRAGILLKRGKKNFQKVVLK